MLDKSCEAEEERWKSGSADTHARAHTHLDDYDIYFFAMKETRCCRYSVARLQCSTGSFYCITANGDQSDVTGLGAERALAVSERSKCVEPG